MRSIHRRLNALLRKARLAARVTQLELGGHLSLKSGHQYVSNWERNICSPPIEKLKRIIDFLNLDIVEVHAAYIADRTEEFEKLIKR